MGQQRTMVQTWSQYNIWGQQRTVVTRTKSEPWSVADPEFVSKIVCFRRDGLLLTGPFCLLHHGLMKTTMLPIRYLCLT